MAQQDVLILVVDDDWMNRELMEAVLQSAGYAVALASNSQGGMQIVRTRHPILALVDVRLQNESGYDLCREIKKLKTNTKVMLITALAGPEEQKLAMQAGADAFISRLTDVAKLLDQIEKLLRA